MNRIITLTACMLFLPSHAFAADLPNNESTQLRSQEEAAIQYQAQIDPDGTPALLKAMQQYRFRHENRVRVRNMIQDAQQQGLPTTPLMNKVHEGISQKMAEENIVQAVERVRNRYEHAYMQANGLSKDKQQADQLGELIATAYEYGLQEKDCTRITAQLQTRTRTTNQQEANELMIQTMVTARIMANRGVESTTIGDILNNALQHSYQASEIHSLQNSFVEQARYGSPEDVARDLSVDIHQGITPSELGSQSNEDASRERGSSESSSSSGYSGSSSGGSSSSAGSRGSGGSGGSGSTGGSRSSGGSGAR